MKKVYIVIEGEYSDWCIVGVFVTKREAEFCASKESDMYILEKEIGKIEVADDKKCGYQFEFYENGNCDLKRYFLPNTKNMIVPNKISFYKNCWHRKVYRVGVMAMNEEQALKIARDLMAKYKAEKKGL